MEKFLLFEIIGVVVIFILGSLFHFLYKYCGRKLWMAIISPVNESIWEHLKIGFYPYLLYALFEYILLDFSNNQFLWSKIIGAVTVIVSILIIEIVYPKFTQKNILVIDLLVFFFCIALGQFMSYQMIVNFSYDISSYYSLLLFIFVFSILSLFTFYPPKLPLFKDSITGRYGI